MLLFLSPDIVLFAFLSISCTYTRTTNRVIADFLAPKNDLWARDISDSALCSQVCPPPGFAALHSVQANLPRVLCGFDAQLALSNGSRELVLVEGARGCTSERGDCRVPGHPRGKGENLPMTAPTYQEASQFWTLTA